MSQLNLELIAAMTLALPLAWAVSRVALALKFPVTPLDDRLGYLDGLRGFLALAVMFHHFVIRTYIVELHADWSAPAVYFFNNLGKGGVSVFFMVTGVVFYPKIVAGFDRVNWPQLYASRAFRILPLSFTVVAIVAAVSADRVGWSSHFAPLATLKTLAFWVSGHGEPPLFGYVNSYRLNADVMWSLQYEWLFYLLILPGMSVIVALLRGRAHAVVATVLLFVVASSIHLVRPDSDRVSYLMLFAFGMLLGEARRLLVVKRVLSGPIVAVVLSAFVIGCMATVSQPYSLLTVTAYALLLLAVVSGNSLFGLLSSPSARALGDASFSIYMLHGLILSGLFCLYTRFGIGPMVGLPMTTIIVSSVSLLSYIVFERPMIELGKRVAIWRPLRDRSLSVEVAP